MKNKIWGFGRKRPTRLFAITAGKAVPAAIRTPEQPQRLQKKPTSQDGRTRIIRGRSAAPEPPRP